MNVDVAVWEPATLASNAVFKGRTSPYSSYGGTYVRQTHNVSSGRQRGGTRLKQDPSRRPHLKNNNTRFLLSYSKDPLGSIAKRKVLSSIAAQLIFQVMPALFLAIFLSASILIAYLVVVGELALAAPLVIIAFMAGLAAMTIIKVYNRAKLEWLRRIRGSAALD